jgi:thiamine biosynthesis protein ThiI
MRIATDDLPFPYRDGDPVAMIRLTGELTTKARRTRARFQRRLARNIKAAFAASGQESELRESWSRLLVRLEPGGSFDPLKRVFGVSSFSVLDGTCAARLEDIVELGTALYAEQVHGRRFAVRSRRSGTHPFSSMDVAVQLGSALNEGATVDLKDPEVEVFVEVRGDRAYFFASKTDGAGGLPLRVEGKAVSLLSGGFDSPVASWMMLRRGVELEYVFCNLGGEAYRRMVLEVAKLLTERWSHGTNPIVHVIDFEPVVEELKRVVRPALLQVALKRQMYRAANRIAGRVRADAIVTGEAVGQVSSQTLANLRAIDSVSRCPVLRPVVGMEKEEIIDLSRRVGTYALSARVQEHCAITDERPATASRSRVLDAAEVDLDPDLLRDLTDAAERVDVRALDLAELAGRALFVEHDIPGATRVDMRPAEARAAAPWSGALVRSYDDLARGFKEFEPTRPVVLLCAQGLLSAQIADRMQEAGFEAYSLRGGERWLRRELVGSRATSTESKEHES